SYGGAQHVGQTSGTRPGTFPPTVKTTSTTEGTPVPTTRVLAETAQFHLYPFPQSNVGLMQPAVDARGNVWVGEMYANRLARLDPTTGAIQTWPVPPPGAGILSAPFSLTVLPNGQVWFGDITGGAVGHLDPTTGRITLYQLADPQATIFSMAHDAKGRIWFTEIVPGRLGMIDPATDRVTELPVPAMSGHPAFLYGLVVTHNGD